MKVIKFFLVLLLFTGCSASTSSNVINDKLFNGYSYPVEGGINSTYTNEDINVIYFYNVKTSNLFSICSGIVKEVKDNQLTIDCSSGEKTVFYYVETEIKTDTRVSAGEKVGELISISDLDKSRYKLNVIFYEDNNDLKSSLTNQEFKNYINIER